MFEISRDTMISEILTNAPEAMPVFQNIGMHCLGCAMASGETLEQAVDYAKSIYGTDDIIWYNNQGGRRPHAVASFPVLSGDQDARLRAVQAAADSTQQAA